MDLITGLPLYASYKAIYNYMGQLNKLLKIIPCMVGDVGILAPATEKLFFDHVINSYGNPQVLLYGRDPRSTSSF